MIISEANSCVNDNIDLNNNQEQKLGYVYRHIRLDTNMPFYIGISTINEGKYKRAYCKHKRNKYWHNVVNKTKYRVEIIMKELPLDKLFEKEKYFIKLYGRKDKGLGTLVNLTDGGDKGAWGTIITDEAKEKLRQANLGKKHTEETKKKMRQKRHSEEHIENLRIQLKGNTRALGSKHTPESRKKRSEAQKGRTHTEEARKKISMSKKGVKHTDESKLCKPVGQYKDDVLIKQYQSARAAGVDGYCFKNISSCCNGKRKNHKGFQWKFL